jgi:putative hydrolase of the HAD superfamily
MTFDIDDTFYDNWPYIKEAEQALTHYIADNYSQVGMMDWAERLRHKAHVLALQPELKYDMGRLRLATLAHIFAAHGYSQLRADEAAKACFDYFYFKRSDFTVRPEYHAILDELADKIPLVAITNGNVNLEQIGISQYFTHVYHASIEHRAKPYPDMFVAAQQALGIPMHAILHTGDCPINDVWGAYKAGMQSAWYADDRAMRVQREKFRALPDVQLSALADLLALT